MGTVTSAPAGIDCGAVCSASFLDGTTVTLTATPDADSLFDGWSGDADCTDGTVAMTSNRTCTSTFTPKPVPTETLTVSRVGIGSGTVTSTPAGIDCGITCSAKFGTGTTVALTALPVGSSVFTGWTGDADCTDDSVTMSTGRTCIANFGPAPDGRGDTIRYDVVNGGATLSSENAARVGAVLVPRTTHDWSPGWTIKTADFNGDGRTDLFFYDQATGVWFKGISDGAFGFSYSDGRWSPGWSVAIVELNGDGRSDVFLLSSTTGAWFRGTSTGDGTGDFSYVGGSWSVGWQVHPVELNGDGLTDLVLYDPVGGQWFRVVNDGAGGFTYTAGA